MINLEPVVYSPMDQLEEPSINSKNANGINSSFNQQVERLHQM
ncbi:hypothetical protein NWP22_14650 [Anabaenopsis tanganyikae CS-531]|uniref:Uncharacterized protein n=1 Tax=Anabaenopsis tanganyikae CS-531 TaxID=2785304 RepID=A0ABT6KGV5_9CYAN|nr:MULTISPECIES: hypothetical protein [Anabaenopsis]MDH6092607.1 hypothetical protein [Anabaenopsis arnoldii]MDH6107088.1 hypothetical protein [Anabaenopsis tanganyikae CS-531]